MASGANPPKARTRYAAKREAVMAAASKVFTDQGVSGFTLAAVAKRMDLHPVSLTYYFKRKEDLAAACLMHTLQRFDAMLAEAETEASAPDRLRRFVAAYFAARRRIALGEEPQLVPFGEIRLIGPPHDDTLLPAYRAFSARIGQLFESEEHPWIREPRRQILSRLVVDQLCWSDTWLDSYQPGEYGRVAERVADIMVHGLAGPGEEWPDLPLLTLGAPPAQNDEITRERFLVAATDLINDEGYRGASVEKISAVLNVTKGSFYHHNTDKDELTAACFERTFGLIDEALRRARAAETGWERLWLASASLAARQASGEGGRMLRHTALAALPPGMRKAVMARFGQIAHSLAGDVVDGIADGSLRPVDPLISAHLVMAMFNSALPLSYWAPGTSLRAVLDAHARPVLTGFFTPKRP